ncbi:NifU-like domain-containing protein [Senna tora]|uniref:NifU-like domain-containing protein n=1 Tax=Senna tora TaxID=362788 RepID=A0A834TJW2_9FABA|nr:NifU-like domain-containing protein [Senna tora]
MSLHLESLWRGLDILNIRWVRASSTPASLSCSVNALKFRGRKQAIENAQTRICVRNLKPWGKLKPLAASLSVPPPLDLTEDNIRQVLDDARAELGQIFDTSVGMSGKVELAELDGPFVKISLKGRFWHKRSTVLARVGNYLKNRIPEILEVDIEDEKQLDDSPENF